MEFVTYEQKGAYAIITISREKALNALNSTVPVSYTHLDVYKRQMLHSVSRKTDRRSKLRSRLRAVSSVLNR